MRELAKFLGYPPEDATSPTVLVEQMTAARRALRLARSEVAELLGLSYEALWAWETGRRRPRGRSLALVLIFLARYRQEND